VREASDASSALTALGLDPHPDVVLLDYRLPGCRGFDLLSAVQGLSPGSAVVMMSADQTADSIAEALRRGVSAMLHKPFDMGTIEPELVRACLARSRPAE
jgi:DNA-binding NtrC family response regulator